MTFFFIDDSHDLGLLARLDGAPLLAVDLETTGRDALVPQCSKIRLIQLSDGRNSFVIDLFRVDALETLRNVLTHPGTTKVFHNAKFDVKNLLYHHSLPVRPIFCTYLTSKLLSQGNANHRHSLADVTRRFLGRTLDKSLQQSDFSRDLTEEQIQYALTDAEILIDLHRVMAPRLAELKLKGVSQLEFRTVLPVAAMELKGIKVDMEQWRDVEGRYTGLQAELEHAILEELRLPGDLPGFNTLNLNAPDQVKEALGLKGIHLSGTSDAELRQNTHLHPVIAELLEHRHVSKILNTSVRHIAEAVLPETGRIHATYFQIASASGRFACADPNIQQVPREPEIRRCFVPQPGYRYVIADYSQVELRVAAGLSEDRVMLDAYRQGQDLHRLTAALTMGKPIEKVTKEERQAAKAINFGLIYAMGAKGLQRSAKNSYGVEMSLEQAKTFRVHFFHNYSGIKAWQKTMEARGRASGYVRTAAGRIRSYQEEEIRVTELLNIPVQGTAAEGLKSALCIFWDAVERARLDAGVVAIIHDEILVEVRQDQASQVKDLLVEAMIQGISWLVPNVPFDVDAAVVSNWSEKP